MIAACDSRYAFLSRLLAREFVLQPGEARTRADFDRAVRALSNSGALVMGGGPPGNRGALVMEDGPGTSEALVVGNGPGQAGDVTDVQHGTAASGDDVSVQVSCGYKAQN